MVVRHKCDVRTCINPEHLELGTPQDNANDMMVSGRHIRPIGERNGQAKLIWEQVNKIRNDNRKNTHIAKDYGVSRECIRDIKRFKIWKST